MKRKIIMVLASLFVIVFFGKSQCYYTLQTGYSYIENFTLAVGINTKNNHNFSLSYGSKFFINVEDFSSYLIQYEKRKRNSKSPIFIPKFGIKSGYSVYTNQYYKWQLLSLIPYLGANYPINKKIDLAIDLGFSLTRELSMQRLAFGEVGWYKNRLPELKASIIYRISPTQHEKK